MPTFLLLRELLEVPAHALAFRAPHAARFARKHILLRRARPGVGLCLRFRRSGDGGAVEDERVARARDVCGVAPGGRTADVLALLLHDGDVCEGWEERRAMTLVFAIGGRRRGRRSRPWMTGSMKCATASRKVSEMRVECRKREAYFGALCFSVLVQPFATCCPAPPLKSKTEEVRTHRRKYALLTRLTIKISHCVRRTRIAAAWHRVASRAVESSDRWVKFKYQRRRSS